MCEDCNVCREKIRKPYHAVVHDLEKNIKAIRGCANCDYVYDSGVGHFCCIDHSKNSPLKEDTQADGICNYWSHK